MKDLVGAGTHGEGHLDVSAQEQTEVFDGAAGDFGYEFEFGQLAAPQLRDRSSQHVVATSGAGRGQGEDVGAVSRGASGCGQDGDKEDRP